MGIRRYSLAFTILFPLCVLFAAFAAWASFTAEIRLEDCRELGLPVLTVDTEGGRKIKSKETYVKAAYMLYDGETVTGGSCKIRGRGNTTWRTRELFKKPYLLKLNEAAPLLGLPSAEKWVLMANTADKTQLRNAYATYLATRVFSGAGWTPDYRFISLFVNGSYNGLYALTEKVEAVPGRLPVSEDDGSFLFEVNSRLNKDWNFRSKQGVPFSIRTGLPPNESRFAAQAAIIQQAEDALFGEYFTDSSLGWKAKLDAESFADWYLIEEFTKNHDARFQSSCYLHYDSAKAKICMGPVWDFDISSGNISWDDCENPEGFWINGAVWYAQLFKDPAFVTLVQNRWLEKRALLEESLSWLSKEADALRDAVMLNDAVWKNIGHRQWPHAPGWKQRKTYQAELNYMTNWLEKRMNWLDNALQYIDRNQDLS